MSSDIVSHHDILNCHRCSFHHMFLPILQIQHSSERLPSRPRKITNRRVIFETSGKVWSSCCCFRLVCKEIWQAGKKFQLKSVSNYHLEYIFRLGSILVTGQLLLSMIMRSARRYSTKIILLEDLRTLFTSSECWARS